METSKLTVKNTPSSPYPPASRVARRAFYAFTIALVMSGCTTRTIEISGVRYHSVRFANKETIGPITVKMGTNTVIIGSYVSDQVTGLAVAVEAAVSAAIKAAGKP